jgi:hypothetical protein
MNSGVRSDRLLRGGEAGVWPRNCEGGNGSELFSLGGRCAFQKYDIDVMERFLDGEGSVAGFGLRSAGMW